MIVSLNKHSGPGLARVMLPAGCFCRQVSLSEHSLNWQFINAPYPNPHTSGHLLIELSEPADQVELELIDSSEEKAEQPLKDEHPAVRVHDNQLRIKCGNHELVFHDQINNEGLDNSEAVEGDKGVFALFNPQSSITLISEGPLARVYRITTPLEREATQQQAPTIAHCTAYYDIVLYTAHPLIELSACFKGHSPTKVAKIIFGNLTIPQDTVSQWQGGLPLFSGDFINATAYVPHLQEGFRDRSFEQFALLTTQDYQVGYIGGTPLLKADGSKVTLSPDADCTSLNIDLCSFDVRQPLTGRLCFREQPITDHPAGLLDLIPARGRCVVEIEDPFSLVAGDLEVEVSVNKTGAGLSAVRDRKSGLQVLEHCAQLFELCVRDLSDDRQITLSSDDGWENVGCHVDEKALHLYFSGPQALPGSELFLQLSLLAVPEQDRVVLQLNVNNLSSDISILIVDYPRLHFDVGRPLQGLVPRGPGEIVPDLATAAVHQHFHYPAYAGSMPFMAVWQPELRRGIYYGIHDREGSFKHIHMESSDGRGMLYADWPVTNLGQPENSCNLPGETVWQLFDGDWYDASQIYREWVIRHAAWIPQIDQEGRTDVPTWLKTAPLWLTDWVDPEGTWLEDALRAQAELSVPTAYHVYQWHEIPFDNDYPHYFPAKKEFISALAKLQEAGIKVMPYINGRLWDTHDRGAEDFQFTELALPSSAKDRHGRPIVEIYLSKEDDGSDVTLAVMCPSEAMWQQKLRSIVDKLFNEIGVDAVYIDQVAAARPQLCMDENHAHPPGGGSWWVSSYYQLLQQLRLVLPAEHAYTTECNGEVYMRFFHAYLTWHWTRANQVPAFSAVYASYTPMFGRCFAARAPGDDNAARILTAQSLLFGEQLGWIKPADYLSQPHRDFFRKAVQIRHRYGSYFYAGRLCPPVEISGDLTDLIALSIMGGTRVISSPAVLGAVWQRFKDHKCLLLIANMAEHAHTVTLQLRPDCPAPVTSELAGDLSGEVIFEAGNATITVPGLSIIVIEYPAE